MIVSAWKSSCVSFSKQTNSVTQEEHRLFVSHPYKGRRGVTLHAAVSVSSSRSLCHGFFLSLSSYVLILSHALFVSHCALLSLPLSSLCLSLMISGSHVYARMCAHVIGQHLEAGCTSKNLSHTETFFLSTGLLPLFGCSQGSLFFRLRRSHNISLFHRHTFSLL